MIAYIYTPFSYPSSLNDPLLHMHMQGMSGEEMKYKDGSQIKDEECTKDSVYDTKVRGTRAGRVRAWVEYKFE